MKTDLKAELEKVLSLVSKGDQKNKQTRIQRQWLSQNLSAACSKYKLKFKPKSVMSLCNMSYIQDAKVGTHYLTGRLVSPILQQIALCLLVETLFYHCNKLLKFKQIQFCLIYRNKKIQSQGQRFFKNIFQYTQSDMLLRFVAVQKEQLVTRMCCSNMSSTVFQPILDLIQNHRKTSKNGKMVATLPLNICHLQISRTFQGQITVYKD